MPRHPGLSPSISAMKGAVYSSVASRAAAQDGESYPFHVGDTWLDPPAGCRMADLRVADHPRLYRYAPVRGVPELVEALARRVSTRTGLPTEPEEVLVTAGATGALAALVGALAAPGDEVLILAPYWPLIEGTTCSFHAVPVAVPFFGEVHDARSATEWVAAYRTERTVALYVNTPNNPTGQAIPREWAEALVAWARDEDLWLISDEVYEDYLYEGEHTWLRTLAPERTVSSYSFSKAYGMAGNRCGYAVGPAEAIAGARKVSTFAWYNAPTASQYAALRALDGRGDEWVDRARRLYADVGREAAARLGQPAPQGSTFLFLDVGDQLDGRGLLPFLERCADRGLLLAPGPSFGPYPKHVRLCFTAVPPEATLRGVDLLVRLLG